MAKHHGVGNGKYYEKRYNKMKTKIIIAILLLSVVSCKSQITITNKNMEYFDINAFRENNANENEKNFILENGDKIQQFKGSGNKGYIERKEYANTAYDLYKEYYENGNLKVKVNMFYNFQVKLRKEYDEKGNLTEEIDYDNDYKFSIDDLGKKMKEEYNIDILKRSPWVKVMRDKIDSGVIYKVMVYLKENKYSDTKNYTVDGITGKVISEKVLNYPKE